MIKLASFTKTQNHAIKEFNALRLRALWNSWLAKILVRNNSLRTFIGSNVTGLQGKRLSGVQRIRVDRIVGTIRRSDDFDKDFRPLKQHLRDRWVNALLRLKTDEWQPIVVHKVGKCYYVADGHHRVSVARSAGMNFIEAKVWDHSSCRMSRGTCVPKQRALQSHTQSFSINQ